MKVSDRSAEHIAVLDDAKASLRLSGEVNLALYLDFVQGFIKDVVAMLPYDAELPERQGVEI
jgi:hypothetical protein